MTFNEGIWDRVVRILAGVAMGYAAWMTWPETATILSRSGIVSLAYVIIGLEVLVTGVIGWSPMYKLFGFSTNTKVGA